MGRGFRNFLNPAVRITGKTFSGQPMTLMDLAVVRHAAGCWVGGDGEDGEDGTMRRHQRQSTPDISKHVEHDA